MESKFELKPLGYRKRIPLYYPKSEEEIRQDRYELYDQVVLKSVRNYYASAFGEEIVRFCKRWLSGEHDHRKIVEIGCGGGYLLGAMAEAFPNDVFIGLDYSYQMLKIAEELWMNGGKRTGDFIFPATNSGLLAFPVERKSLHNVEFGLSKADLLPISDGYVDVVYSSFLWDRLSDLDGFLLEQKRILKRGGHMIIISPFNYLQRSNWEAWYPIGKLVERVVDSGFTLLERTSWQEKESMDRRGNGMLWDVEALVFEMD